MNAPDASHGEMPGFPFPGRPGPEADDLLGMILDGRSLPPDAPEDLHALAVTLADLAGPAGPGELAGEAAVRSALARRASPVGVSPARPARRKPPRRAPPRSARAAAGLVVAAIGLGGTAAAAYAGALPGPIQNLAHRVIHAPPAHRAGHPKPPPGNGQPGHRKTVVPTAPPSRQPATPKLSPKPAKPPKPDASPKPAKPPKPGASPRPTSRPNPARRPSPS
jgi:hypothetical protein